ncbi:thioesterase family protein [Luedemannella helvata]|uniref:Thioesterase family protein n=1 Tax=Luedemannella helvata TaxID=349315 RepID=A0ABN2KNF1_9ACTN
MGARAGVELTVSEADTAQELGSGDVPVLGTPRALALAEAATVAATAGALEPGLTTVGTRVELEHLAPTPVGHTVRALATLLVAEGRALTFEVTVHDGDTLVAQGRVHRVIVDRQTFVQRATGG